MSTRGARFARGQLAAAVSTVVAAFSHGAASGAHPPLFAIALALAFSGIACVFLSRPSLSRLRLALSVAVSQLLYHGLFALFGASNPVSSVALTPHQHGAISLSFVEGPSPSSASHPADTWMLVAHVMAAIATFAILMHGENVCLALADLTGLVISALAFRAANTLPLIEQRTTVPSGYRMFVPRRVAVVSSSRTRRGPPVLARLA